MLLRNPIFTSIVVSLLFSKAVFALDPPGSNVPSVADSSPDVTAESVNLRSAVNTSEQQGDAEFSKEFSTVTKEILLRGIELERFSLNYRLEAGHQPKFRKLRYFLTQETGAACGLAFEITGVNEFGKGRERPLAINKRHLKNSLSAVTTGSIIAGAGSCFELSANVVREIRNKKSGYDAKSANRFVSAKLHEIDELLARRDQLVSSHSSDPSYDRLVLEGKVLRAMRQSFVNEYSAFHTSVQSLKVMQNLFYALNATYNAVGATAAGVARNAVDKPKLNGPANILFIVSGGLAMATPLVTSAGGWIERKIAHRAVERAVHGTTTFEPKEFSSLCEQLKVIPNSGDSALISSLPATERFAMYSESSGLFVKQIQNETSTMAHLNKVALQTAELGPAIGSLLMTQGILGTRGYYKYTFRPRKQIDQYYKGAILGTIGTSAAVVGNAAWLLASWSYENKLKKKEQLPEQLIRKRLQHLDDVEKQVQAI